MRQRATAVIIRGDKLLLVRDKGANHYSLPGGKIELNESSEKAVARELEEELGLSTVTVKRLDNCDFTGSLSQHNVFLVQVSNEPEIKSELDGFIWWDMAKPIPVFEHVNYILGKIKEDYPNELGKNQNKKGRERTMTAKKGKTKSIGKLRHLESTRSDASQAMDERQRHSVVGSPTNPKDVKKWLKDPASSDLQGVDTPASKKARGSPRKNTKPTAGKVSKPKTQKKQVKKKVTPKAKVTKRPSRKVSVVVIPVIGKEVDAKVGGRSVGGVLKVTGEMERGKTTAFLTSDSAGDMTVSKTEASALKPLPGITRGAVKKAMDLKFAEHKGGSIPKNAIINSKPTKLGKPGKTAKPRIVPPHKAKRGSGLTRRSDR